MDSNRGWKIVLSTEAEHQMRKLDKGIQGRIFNLLDRLLEKRNPRLEGKSLRGNLKEFWRYRVGGYRVLCLIEDREMVILVVKVGLRRDVYTNRS